jgi:uncharacterized protein YdcH (DUF465 family)
MQILPHDLEHEFPEYASQIRELKARDGRLALLCEEYEQINAAIVDIEENDKPFEDLQFELMKKKRLRLKDQIHHLLRGQHH